MDKRILVTGPTGKVGSQVIKYLKRKDNVEIIAGVHHLNDADRFESQGIKIVEFELDDPETIENALSITDRLFLLTPMTPDMERRVQNVVEQTRNNKVEFIVRLSFYGASDENPVRLGELHRKADQVVINSGIPYTILRPNSFMQNFSEYYADSIREMDTFYLAQGDGKISYIDTRDIGNVAATILAEPTRENINQIYTLTGSQALDNFEVADIFSRVMGRQIKYVNISKEEMSQYMRQQKMPDWIIDIMMEYQDYIKKNMATRVTGRVVELTGMPPYTFREFSRDYKEQFEKQPVKV
ncbi:MAG: SDR family oxidoreductase [Vulcanimicrobiota bacterium]